MTPLRPLVLAAALFSACAAAGAETITVASTTSTEHSGLFAHILPNFEADTGISVRVVAQGTGQALETARRGDADVAFVHARAMEEAFVAAGYGVARHEVMSNDFVLVGPGDDPVGLAQVGDAAAALGAIAAAEAPFASRGDDSGTHVAELALWEAAGVAPGGAWYRETGSGMGPTLNTAVQMGAHALTDRATWASFANRGDHAILFAGDPAMRNAYGVILVDPERHPHVKAEAGQRFIDWLTAPEGQAAIADFEIDGAQVFFPSASPSR